MPQMQFAGANMNNENYQNYSAIDQRVIIENINVNSTGTNASEIVSDITAEMLRKLGTVQFFNRKRGG
jgi:hypothetical protein